MEVQEKLKQLDTSRATGLDNIPGKFLQDAAGIIAPCVAHIANLAIDTGTFPSEMKSARVIPLHKKGNKLEPGNYRPISILGVLSKTIERLVYAQIYMYFSTNNLMYKYQSGFRRSHSTDTCLLFLTDYIRKEVDEGKFCGMVMLDLQKAFDSVDHNILLMKLRALGFNEAALKCIGSYLTGRQQVVDINGVFSSPRTVECGVPQKGVYWVRSYFPCILMT